MTTKLGKFLVGRGNITEDQLEKAFRAQLVFGGRLGTNLVELGYITEKVLGEALAEILKVPYATFEHLQEIPASVIHLIPKGLSARYRVVPILREEKTLHLAMIDQTSNSIGSSGWPRHLTRLSRRPPRCSFRLHSR